ncbi:MAG: response regulator [Ruminococcaceae bacterium]|nr:response regulator [Oscillospiraceae bacterium]
MYKMLIVDDNNMQIHSLLQYLDWESFGVTEIKTAQDGAEGLRVYKSFLPDIVITDVLMPEMNGIELTKEIQKINKNTKFIFISCCEEVEFLREAIEVDAISYILKPIEPKTLQENVEKLIARIERDKKYESMSTLLKESMEAYRKNFFYRLIYSKYINPDYMKNTIANLEFDKFHRFVIAKLELVDIKDRFIDIYNLLNLTESDLFTEEKGMAVIENEVRMVVMYMSTGKDSETFFEKVREVLLSYSNSVKGEYNISLNIGLSKVHDSLYNHNIILEEATCALENNFSFEGGGVHSYSEFGMFQPDYNILDIKEALGEVLSKNSSEQIELFMDNFCPENIYSNQYSIRVLCMYVYTVLQIILVERNMAGDDILKNISNIWSNINILNKVDDARAWLYKTLNSTLSIISSKEFSAHDKIIHDINMQINNNFNKITCMDQIAADLYISESYARRIYKQYTGKTIFEAMFIKRMEEAKKLLVNFPQMRIYEVASAVGYKSKQYFIEAFKRSEGCIPKEYRQKMLNGKSI